MGQRIWSFSHGIDEREVQPQRERKSIGVEKTLFENIVCLEQGLEMLDELYQTLLQRIRHASPQTSLSDFRKLGVKLKFEDFQITTLEKSAVEFNREIFAQLLCHIWQRRNGRSIRLIGLHVNIPDEKRNEQMSLW